MANIYKVYIDDPDAGNVAAWTMEAASPASAILKVMKRVPHGKNGRVKSFEVSAELEVPNMTYAEYKMRAAHCAYDEPCKQCIHLSCSNYGKPVNANH